MNFAASFEGDLSNDPNLVSNRTVPIAGILIIKRVMLYNYNDKVRFLSLSNSALQQFKKCPIKINKSVEISKIN